MLVSYFKLVCVLERDDSTKRNGIKTVNEAQPQRTDVLSGSTPPGSSSSMKTQMQT